MGLHDEVKAFALLQSDQLLVLLAHVTIVDGVVGIGQRVEYGNEGLCDQALVAVVFDNRRPVRRGLEDQRVLGRNGLAGKGYRWDGL
jgi:hypothetical protein